MYGISYRLVDSVTPWLRQARIALRQDEIRPIAGRAGTNVVRAHLFDLDKTRANSLGGKRTHFYASAARATHFKEVTDGVEISVSHVGFAQRYFGGVIRPVNSKYLAIPARTEAYGKSPREFDDLEPAFGRRGIIGLAEKRRTAGEGGRGEGGRFLRAGTTIGGGIMFWLVDEVDQDADPTVIPTEAELQKDVLIHIDAHIDRLRRRRVQAQVRSLGL